MMYVWGVNSTVTKHSDYIVWKDTSERVTRRCDDTIDKSEWILVYYNTSLEGMEGVEQPKQSPKTPGNAFSNALLNATFLKFPARGFLKPRFARF